ncbi:hypothetical protein Tco_1521270, partial [Tanacetum coccineum]
MLKKLPSGIGGMASLQFLSKVISEGSNGFKISKLKGMMELRDLVLEWSDVFDASRNKENENEVFENLKPHRMPIAPELFPSLEVLELEDMQGWENWSVNNDKSGGSTILFPCLFEISIVDYPKLVDVSVGKMSSLRV